MERGSFQRAAPVFHLIGSLKNSHEALERNITRYGIQQTKAKFYILWSSPGIASAVVSALIAYTTFYATDVLQLNAGLVGTLLLVSKLFDGVTDLVAVFLVDRMKNGDRWRFIFALPVWYLHLSGCSPLRKSRSFRRCLAYLEQRLVLRA